MDESGDHGLTNIDPDFPVFVLCGILISESNYALLQEQMNAIKRDFWGEKKVIFHSRDIRKCEKEFQIFFNAELKKAFYERINAVISSNNYTVISSAINKEEYIHRYGKLNNDVYEIALSFIVERSIFFLDDVQERNKELHLQIEKRGKKENKKLDEHFQRLLSRGTGFVESARLKNYGMTFTFFDKQEDINGLQLSDLIAYPIARYVIDYSRANPAFELVEKKIYTKNNRRYGLKVYP